jgi:enoyl-CoA hydratase
MCDALLDAATSMAADPSVRVVIVRANGPAFCAGADLKERRTMTPEQVRDRRLKAFAAYDALERLPMPSIAMVHGAVIGSGGEIATACDFVIASETATFRYPEAVGGTIGATQRLPRIVGLARAKELLFTGRTLTAAEALAWRLVNHVVPLDALETTTLSIAERVAAAPAASIRLTKRCLDESSAADRRGALAAEIAAIDELLSQADSDGGLPALEQVLRRDR